MTIGDRLAELDSIERKSLKAHRDMRWMAWHDYTQDELDRVVFGITGSREMLEKYRELARKVGQVIGQPVIKIRRITDGRSGSIDGLVYSTIGGIISDELSVGSSSLSRKEHGNNSGGGHAYLNIPVNPLVATHDWQGFQTFSGEQVHHERVIEAAHLTDQSWNNRTNDPSNDFYDAITEPPLIGYEEIYASPYFQKGLSKVMLAILVVAKETPAAVTI